MAITQERREQHAQAVAEARKRIPDPQQAILEHCRRLGPAFAKQVADYLAEKIGEGRERP